MKEDSRPLMVTIQCCTYNHENYIRQCLDGFVMQKTNFRFEAIIHDDASTDGTASIIREYAEKYPDIIKPIYETENQYSKRDGSLARIMDEHTHGKYIAICEGDDYWIDPLKLQKQVDFMESHSDYSMCFTDVVDYYEDKNQFGDKQSRKYCDYNSKLANCNKESFYNILLGKSRIQTLTVLIRSYLYFKKESDSVHFMMGDTQLWLYMSQVGKIKYLEECTGVYRIHEGSASRNRDNYLLFRFSMFEMRVFYCLKYNYKVPLSIVRNYNKALVSLIFEDVKLDREPLYTMFEMPCLQNMLYKKALTSHTAKIVISLIWKFESFLSLIFKY